MDALLLGLLPFITNGVVSVANWAGNVQSTAGKRFVLAVISLIGVVAAGVLNGTPVDVNSVSSLATTAIEALVAFLAAHGSYHLFFKAAPTAPITPSSAGGGGGSVAAQ